MITQKMLEGLTPEEIVTLLRDNAFREEENNVKHYFTEQEMEDMRKDLTQTSIDRHAKQEELKEISSGLRGEIKKLTSSINENLRDLKRKFYEQEETVFLLADHDKGRMYYYNISGELMSERKLLPSEKQTKILNLNQKSA